MLEFARRFLTRWPGRIVLGSMQTFKRVETFDRCMSIAAQFFTSVFPVLILIATWANQSDVSGIIDSIPMTQESQAVLDDALGGADSAGFGVLGGLFVLVSATSLSRALTRAYAAIWSVRAPKSTLASVWRWLAVVLALAASLVLVRVVGTTLDGLPPRDLWPPALVFCFDIGISIFVPWVLLAGAVAVRSLIPGALIFAVAMAIVRPASEAWLPRALDSSAERYGSIGVAFTYLAALYAVSFCTLVAAIVGRTITVDDGGIGRWIRQERADGSISAT